MANTVLLKVRKDHIEFGIGNSLYRFTSVRHDDRKGRRIDAYEFRDKGAAFLIQMSQDSYFVPESDFSFRARKCLSNVAVACAQNEGTFCIFEWSHNNETVVGDASNESIGRHRHDAFGDLTDACERQL